MADKEYIDREQAMRAVEFAMELTPSEYEMISNEIDQIPAADVVEAPKWISVEERLPEESGNYLVYFVHHAAVITYSAVHRAFNAFDDQTEFWVEKTRLFPRYWMPLPEPPREVT